jgi:acyl carrier protein
MSRKSVQELLEASKYDRAFIENFAVDESELQGLAFQSVSEWDSVGHMALMAWIEEAFDITLEMDDVLDFSSYEKGKEILGKYGIEI